MYVCTPEDFIVDVHLCDTLDWFELEICQYLYINP